jgi:muramoyltetrapeptide carboxypeptidase
MNLPPKLELNDEVIIIAPARKVELESLEFAEKLLLKWGLKPLRSKNILAKTGIFAGDKEKRVLDLQWAINHPTAKAIWCFRGGYGAIQLLEGLNPALFLQNPKWIIGFSDITNIHCFSNIILNTASIHATMPINIGLNTPQSLESLKDFLFKQEINYKINSASKNIHGEVKGAIVGGNLSILTSSLGTNYQPDFENKILFIEDIDEYLYKVDRMIWQLKFAGVFHQIKGLIIGHFTNIKDNSTAFGMSIEEIILQKVKEFDFPVIFNFPCGHENENLTLPFGIEMNLKVNSKTAELYN